MLVSNALAVNPASALCGAPEPNFYLIRAKYPCDCVGFIEIPRCEYLAWADRIAASSNAQVVGVYQTRDDVLAARDAAEAAQLIEIKKKISRMKFKDKVRWAKLHGCHSEWVQL